MAFRPRLSAGLALSAKFEHTPTVLNMRINRRIESSERPLCRPLETQPFRYDHTLNQGEQILGELGKERCGHSALEDQRDIVQPNAREDRLAVPLVPINAPKYEISASVVYTSITSMSPLSSAR